MGPPILCALALSTLAAGAHDAQKDPRFTTSRTSPVEPALPSEEPSFSFVVFGDRTGGPAEGVAVLREAVAEVNLIAPDLVMTVGDLVEGYNETPRWLAEMREYRTIMDELACPWFPVAGNHDVYWGGKGTRPRGGHERDYEEHFGPLWYAFRHKDAWFFALYSDEGDPATGKQSFSDPACQRIGEEQFRWLDQTLERARAAKHVFLFLHHPRWLEGQYGDDWRRVHARLVANGNVTAVFAGHIHRMRHEGKRDGIEYVTLATVGGEQEGHAPRAGFLHQYHLVTVRESGLSMAAFPVGGALDPRAITGTRSVEIERLATRLETRWQGEFDVSRETSVVVLEVQNPLEKPIAITAAAASEDSRWSMRPDHVHLEIEAGRKAEVRFAASRPPRSADRWLRPVRVDLDVEYRDGGWSVALPTRELEVPLARSSLPLPSAPEQEVVLALAGGPDALLVEGALVDLADGPLTLECWFQARHFDGRTGLVTKTENSEYGIFVSDGHPSFSVHLGGRYHTVERPDLALEPGRWHHVAGVFDGEEVRLYLDGERVARAQASGVRTRNALPLAIGADVDKHGRATSGLAGLVDEVLLVPRASYVGERFTPARAARAPDDAVLHLPMHGFAGPYVADHSGRAAHARVSGGARLVESTR